MLHPVYHLAVLDLLKRDMGHRHIRCGAVPVPFTRCKPDDITGANLLHRLTLTLRAAKAGYHDQGLAERMGVPGGAGAGFESHLSTLHPFGIEGVEERIDTDRTGEPGIRAFAGRSCSRAQYFHGCSPDWSRAAI
ncbi:hypothetical protein D3C87_826780 [compost metagenome]